MITLLEVGVLLLTEMKRRPEFKPSGSLELASVSIAYRHDEGTAINKKYIQLKATTGTGVDYLYTLSTEILARSNRDYLLGVICDHIIHEMSKLL